MWTLVDTREMPRHDIHSSPASPKRSSVPMTSLSKRVILRIPVHDVCNEGTDDYLDILKAYLDFSGQPSADISRDYGVHIEPIQSPDLNQTSCHIILDMNKHSVKTPDLQNMPHEIYRVRKKDGVFQVIEVRNELERRNLLAKMRHYTDTLYAWGD